MSEYGTLYLFTPPSGAPPRFGSSATRDAGCRGAHGRVLAHDGIRSSRRPLPGAAQLESFRQRGVSASRAHRLHRFPQRPSAAH
jgi:hypothetical protein